MMDVIDEIVQRRRAAGLSQQELARRSGVKQPNLARIELRQTKPRLDTVENILSALGCELIVGEKS